jgi:hypothetical protein
MPTPVRGAGGTGGFGTESTWGTPVARTNWLPMVSMGVHRRIINKAEPDMGRLGAVSTMHRFPYVESDFSDGPISWVAAYDDSTIFLLTHMLGMVSTTGAGPFVHDVKLASPPPVGFTFEEIRGIGNGTLTNITEVFEGCKIAGGRITLVNGGLLMVEADIIAQTSAGLVAAGTPTYSTGGNRIRHNQTPGVSLGGTLRQIQSLTITIDRGLTRNHEIGSLLTSEPYEEGLTVGIELKTKWQADAFDTVLLSGAQADLTIPFTGTGANLLTITAHNCQVDSVEHESNGRGAIEETIKLTPYQDATDQGLSFAFTNANTLATAN